jgi:hypothetical protein
MEYLHYLVGIVNHCVRVKELREVLLTEELKSESTNTYIDLLKGHVEKQAEVISIPKLYQKVVRQRKELEQWFKAK